MRAQCVPAKPLLGRASIGLPVSRFLSLLSVALLLLLLRLDLLRLLLSPFLLFLESFFFRCFLDYPFSINTHFDVLRCYRIPSVILRFGVDPHAPLPAFLVQRRRQTR